MTTISQNSGFHYTRSVVDQLAAATNTRYTTKMRRDKRGRLTYFADGYKFSTPKAFVEHMLTQANTWLIENGLVDLDLVRSINRSGYRVFTVNQ